MSAGKFLGELVGSGVGTLAKDLGDVVDKFVQTKEEKDAAELLRLARLQRPDEWQIEINKIEAGHRSLFVAGWRPAIGWICAIGLLWGWVVSSFVKSILGVLVAYSFIPVMPEMPALAMGEIVSLVMAILGMGALRSYEKRHRITK